MCILLGEAQASLRAPALPLEQSAKGQGLGWSAMPTVHKQPVQTQTDGSTQSEFREGRESMENRMNLKKKVSCRRKIPKAKNTPQTKSSSFQHVITLFPHGLKQSPYGLESEVHGRRCLSTFSTGRLSSKKLSL